jgi:hypothetical protein
MGAIQEVYLYENKEDDAKAKGYHMFFAAVLYPS